MHWNIQHTAAQTEKSKRHQEILEAIFLNRGLTKPKDQELFFNPPSPFDIKATEVGINADQLTKTVKKIHQAIENKQPLIVYGDYDADGITATAILWEALISIGAKAIPFIPQREAHGYGLSIKGLEDLLSHSELRTPNFEPLFITVDNGIVAFEAAEYLKQNKFELIITDHHQPADKLPIHYSLVHSTQIAGSAVAWFLAKELNAESARDSLDLVTIGTVTDLLPLQGANRAIVKHGLPVLQQARRPGIKALLDQAQVDLTQELSTYHIGYIIGPRLNAMGRLEDAMDALRLLCTKKHDRALDLAQLLADTNVARQDLTQEFIDLAETLVTDPSAPLLIVKHADFHEGVVGLVAGRLAEKYYRPTIVISLGQDISKASARSIRDVNIIELIRTQDALLVNAGGHPGAAGFSIETDKLDQFAQQLLAEAHSSIDPELLKPVLDIDCQIELNDIDWELFEKLEELKPFGLKNPQPIFSVEKTRIASMRTVGREKQHLSVAFQDRTGHKFNGIGFRLASKVDELAQSQKANIAFTIDQNSWNGNTSLQLKLKDIIPA